MTGLIGDKRNIVQAFWLGFGKLSSLPWHLSAQQYYPVFSQRKIMEHTNR